jgi:precorrin-6Y C5,15-methyltransferase (decarboxylating)
VVFLAYPVTVVGVGPGSREYLLPVAEEAVLQSDVLVGGARALELFAHLGKQCYQIDRHLDAALDFIERAREKQRVAVLLSGDPGYFSLLPRLRARLGEKNLIVIPGISSLQLACARLGLNWEDFFHVSLHGRGLDQLEKVGDCPKVAVLTEKRFPPSAVCRFFLEKGNNFQKVWILTDLGLPGEQVTSTTLEEGAWVEGRANSIVILVKDCEERRRLGRERPDDQDDCWRGKSSQKNSQMGKTECHEVVTPGLPDDLFLRGNVAMSKEEVRALVLCKARLRKGMAVYEIGAGSGSWTVEVARLIKPGQVYAFEKDPEALALARANLKHFQLTNVVLVEGEAPEACEGFPPGDCVLVGGSGGRLEEILRAAKEWLRPGGRLVITAVTPETFSTAWQLLQDEAWEERDAVLLQLARVQRKGRVNCWQGENPVFILSASRGWTTG